MAVSNRLNIKMSKTSLIPGLRGEFIVRIDASILSIDQSVNLIYSAGISY